MATKKNPEVKIGDKLLVKASRNGTTGARAGLVGSVVTVVTERVNSYIYVRTEAGIQHPLYYSGPADTFEKLDRPAMKKHLTEEIKNLNEEIAFKEEQVLMLDKFESEEEEVAYKLSKIFDASNKKNPVKAIAEVLKTLNQSNYL